MKINGFNNVFRLPGTQSVASKKNEGDGGSGRNEYDPNQTRKDSQEQGQKQGSEKFDPEKIVKAVEAFRADEVTQANGLSAVLEGTGPGLRIAVKDINGTTLRQFSGDEFLRLREAAKSTGPRPRGKILDQKL